MYIERLKILRENNNLIQEDLAKILGIERGLYSQYETEYTIMPIKHLNTICNYFHVSIDYVFHLTDTVNYKESLEEIDKYKAGRRLKEFRKEHKMTQVKLASILNVGQSTIAEYERGTNLIATPFLYQLCKTYKVSADYLVGKTH